MAQRLRAPTALQRTRFNPHYPCGSLYLSITPVPGNPTHSRHINRQNTNAHKKLRKKKTDVGEPSSKTRVEVTGILSVQ